jgi:HPt (histidine-containing phosphotransfer) domain-containing protein
MLDRGKLAKILGLLGSTENGEIISAGRTADALIRKANTSWAEVLNQNAVGDETRALVAENEELREMIRQLVAETRALVAENEELREMIRQLVAETRAMLAENEELRETTQPLLVENRATRKRAARRLAHRIADGAKQCGQALITLAIAFDSMELPRHQLAARPRASESRSIRSVVVRSLVAAGMLLTLGIVALLSLHDVAMLGEPSIRSGTVASPGQETPEGSARSGGLPTQAEQRATISDPPLIAATATPEAIPQPTPPDAALSPVEDFTTLSATLPPAVAAPGQTARAAEAPPPVTSLAPAEEQAAPPATSRTTWPPPTQSPPNRLSAAEIAALVTRGDAFLSAGDIVSARLFYERAADGGDGGAALRLGVTFDPAFLSRTGVRGTPDDLAQASSLYRRALDLGNPAAQEHLQNLEQRRVLEPGSPPH